LELSLNKKGRQLHTSKKQVYVIYIHYRHINYYRELPWLE